MSGDIWPQSSQIAEPLWIDHKEWNWCARANLHLKKKKKVQVGNEWSNILPESLQARKKPLPPPLYLRFFQSHHVRLWFVTGVKQAACLAKAQVFEGLPKSVEHLIDAVDVQDNYVRSSSSSSLSPSSPASCAFVTCLHVFCLSFFPPTWSLSCQKFRLPNLWTVTSLSRGTQPSAIKACTDHVAWVDSFIIINCSAASRLRNCRNPAKYICRPHKWNASMPSVCRK